MNRRCTLPLLYATFACSSLLAQSPDVSLRGAEGALEQNIRSHLVTPNADCDSTQRRLERFEPQVRQTVTRAARALGYYYLTQNLTFTAGDPCWALRIDVEPGDPITVGEIDITIQNDEELFEDTLDDLPVSTGDQLNHAAYENVKSALSSQAVEYGFFNARFNTSELRLDLQDGTAGIAIDFAPGERYRFGDISIVPVEALADDFIRRFIEFEPGMPYSTNELINLRNDLNNSQYFSEVTVTPSLTQASNQRIPVNVTLQARPRKAYSAGVGMTTDIGPRVRFSYADRYINRRGHRFESGLAASPIQQTFDMSYTIPMSNPATESLGFAGGYISEDLEEFEYQTSKLGVTYSQVNDHDWRQNYFVNYQHDEYQLNDDDNVSDLFVSGSNLSRTVADDAIVPRNGWRLFGQLSGASEMLLSSTSFAQLYLSGRYVQGLGPGRLLLDFEAGASFLEDEFAELPVSLRYFAGGDQSVRGYRYQSLGPENENGDVIGGKHLMVAGLEYDFPVYGDNWRLAVFLDAGNAFTDYSDYELKKGAGIGLRWVSPIGPIRIDLASALDDDSQLRLHITMGPDL
ncbi:MAG: autotransporter assembly complex family protein [Pseudohongiellaceae bacterium]